MNSFRVVLSLTIAFIIALVANTTKGYIFFFWHINTILLVCGVTLLLYIMAACIFRKKGRQTSL
ncbi:hypothetical protein [Mucilaginibacter agri]|uniref:Uncharacterized protein n=1 Tax=Mucilaginibacter agri TaxID=2695265 RepID=A0A965ZCJ5_9SPHI|nr:hypothetical protein [Mucilaginibacter agri]NCD68225.1 hypothetical protein [Mucilaginibacter agri]